jgi:hypothetical protein
LAKICVEYCDIYERFRDGAVAAEKAPYLEDPQARSNELKAMALFFDATLTAACDVTASLWLRQPTTGHCSALVLAVEYNDQVEDDNPLQDLIRGSDGAVAKMRATEIAAIVSAYIRQLGFSAVAHAPHNTDVALAAIAVQAGLARLEDGVLVAPFIGARFAIGVVTTDMRLAPDRPLAPRGIFDGGAAWWLGTDGTENMVEPLARAPSPRRMGQVSHGEGEARRGDDHPNN